MKVSKSRYSEILKKKFKLTVMTSCNMLGFPEDDNLWEEISVALKFCSKLIHIITYSNVIILVCTNKFIQFIYTYSITLTQNVSKDCNHIQIQFSFERP